MRDVRGFAVKFYRDEGNFDLVGNNERVDYIHVSFSKQLDDVPPTLATGLTVRLYVWHRYRCSSSSTLASPIPTTRSRRRRPHYNFISLTTESAHMIMWVLSGRAIPRSYRTMQGFGVHSFLLVNKEGRRRFAKFHWIPKLGTHPLVWDEAQKLAGVDPDFHRRDLYEAIEAGAYPEWDLGLQIVDEEDEHKFDFDLLDSTKIVPRNWSRCAASVGSCSTATRTTSSASRSPTARRTWCPASRPPTTPSSRAASSPTLTRS